MAIVITIYADEYRWAALIDDWGKTNRLSGERTVKNTQENRIHGAMEAMKKVSPILKIVLQSNSKGMIDLLKQVDKWKAKTRYFKDASALETPFLQLCAMRDVSFKRIQPLVARRIVGWSG